MKPVSRLSAILALSILALALSAAQALAAPKAYTLNYEEDSVAVIDTQTNQVVGSPIEVGVGPYTIAITPDGKTAYVGNETDEDISVIDLQTNQVVGEPIEVGTEPYVLAISPDGKTAYMTNSAGTVTVIDLQTNLVVGTIAIEEGEPSLWGVAFSPDGQTAYVVNEETNTLAVIDTQTRQVVGAPIPTGEYPYEVAITPDGKTAYTADYGGQTVTAINTQSDQPSTISDPGGPWQIVVAPDRSPTPSFLASQAKPGAPVAFNGSASSDPDGSIASFDWSFGDGATALNGGPTPSHQYATGGTYTASLSVTDNEGCSISLVFTGRTAYCNGSSLASHAIGVLPPNRFRFGKVKKNRHKGTATLQVTVPAAGALALTSKKVRAVKKHATRAGKVTLTIRPKAKANKALKLLHHLKVHLRVKFTPTGGTPTSKSKALTLVRRG